jgi:diamine N-acetyltransferase
VEVTLKKIDRGNWREAIALKVRDDQAEFVSTPVRSLAAAFVRQYGDEFEYLTMGICDGPAMVGYVAIVSDPATHDQYWIDDILIDASRQGKGYGRPAVIETIRFILRTYPRCEVVRLSCHRNNHVAAALYQKLGFRPTGTLNATSGQPDYELSGAPLDAYRA